MAHYLQQGMRITSHPFEQIANIGNVSSREILEWIKYLREEKVIRRFGAVLNHRQVGYRINALVIWSVPEAIIERMGKSFAEFPFISHCYERKPAFHGKYNLFTMLHSSDNNIYSLVKDISKITGTFDYVVLESIKEYKKTSPEYF